MCSNTLPAVEILDNFEECNTSLIFIEASLRCLLRSGNLNEDKVGDGLSFALQSIIDEYKKIQTDIQTYIDSVVLSTFNMAASNDGEDEKT
jgi:hypothetical protein